MQTGFVYTKFADRLMSICEVSAADLELLAKMPFTIGHFAPHAQILRKGDQPDRCCLLLRGYLCWRETGGEGGQITSLYMAGDMPDLHTLVAAKAVSNLCTLGSVVVAFVPHVFLRETASASEGLSRALSRLAFVDAALLRNWIVNLGSRDSLTRVAHLFCETALRLRAIGQARDYQFASPFTQSDLAAACGISPVHANRVIQELRRKRLLNWRSRLVTITDWEGLAQLARFDPDYLCLGESSGMTSRTAPGPALQIGADDPPAVAGRRSAPHRGLVASPPARPCAQASIIETMTANSDTNPVTATATKTRRTKSIKDRLAGTPIRT